MKAVSLLMAAVGGAGFLYRGQLQSLVNLSHGSARNVSAHHQAPEGVYYLRTAQHFLGASGTVHWSPGQELRTAAHTANEGEEMTLTDGRNIWSVPRESVTSDMDDAAALRQIVESTQGNAQPLTARQQPQTTRQPDSDRLVAGRFHSTTLDVPAVPTGLPENIVSTAAAPVIYPVYQTSQTVVIERTVQPTIVRQMVVAPQRIAPPPNSLNPMPPRSMPPPPPSRGMPPPPPRSTPPPVINRS